MPNKYYENYYTGEYKYNSCEDAKEEKFETTYACSYPKAPVPPCQQPVPPCPSDVGCEFIDGNSLEIEVSNQDCEVRADIEVARRKMIRVWGQVKDCNGEPVPGALVKLLKPIYVCGKIRYTGVAHTVTDCLGFYQFDLCPTCKPTKFRILVGKAATGNERFVESSGECTPCAHSNPYKPCD